jgi:hypothetical protein
MKGFDESNEESVTPAPLEDELDVDVVVVKERLDGVDDDD